MKAQGEDNEQRENIFHTQFLINGKVCGTIIDSGNCANVASTLFVERSGLTYTKHPNPIDYVG